MRLKKHIPNILSSSRLLSPFVLIPLILNGNLIGSVVALSGFLMTDALDGFLARKWHVQSDLGAKIDVVADKLILASLLIPLVVMNPIIMVTLSFEGLISLVNVVRKLKGGNPKTIQFGRIKMVIISLFMVFCYLSKLIVVPEILFNAFFAITTLFQIGTLSKYIDIGLKEKRTFSNNIEPVEMKNDNNEKEIKDKCILEKSNEIDKVELLEKDKNELLKLRDKLINFNDRSNLETCDSKTMIKTKKMSKNL